MDPDACLARMRELAEWDSDASDGSVVDALSELQEKVAALDAWLVSGGFRPTEWS